MVCSVLFCSGLVWSCLVCSGLVWPEYYSISAANVFVLVHSNFDHHYYYYYNRQSFFSRPVVEVSLRDDLTMETCAMVIMSVKR